MKIQDILKEGMNWTDAGWIGGASDEGHADFDPMQRSNGGRTGPRYAPTRPQNPYRGMTTAHDEFLPVRVPYAVKDAFKEVVGKGNYVWDGDHKTWKMRKSMMTPEMRQRLFDMEIELPR